MVVLRVLKWEDFKNRMKELSPEIIFYRKEPHPLRKTPIGLRLIFYHKKDTYVFIDFADGSTLKKTGIPVNTSEKREWYIDDAYIKNFLVNQFCNIIVVSMGCFSID